jgi:hypothetical protein
MSHGWGTGLLVRVRAGLMCAEGFAGKKTPPKDNFSSEALYENKIM